MSEEAQKAEAVEDINDDVTHVVFNAPTIYAGREVFDTTLHEGIGTLDGDKLIIEVEPGADGEPVMGLPISYDWRGHFNVQITRLYDWQTWQQKPGSFYNLNFTVNAPQEAEA